MFHRKLKQAPKRAEITQLLRDDGENYNVPKKKRAPTGLGRLARVTVAAAITLGLAFVGLEDGQYHASINIASCGSNSESTMPSRQQTKTNRSDNWSGYEATSKKFTSISASWAVSCISGSFLPKNAAQWIGLGDSSIIQTGIIYRSVVGLGEYTTFYETYPGSALPLGLKVEPGDRIYAGISLISAKADLWRITMQDLSRGESASRIVQYNGADNTAEWIVEHTTQFLDTGLADFNVAKFGNTSASVFGVAHELQSLRYTPYSMIGAEVKPMAVTSGLSGNGSFSVYFDG